MRGKEMEERKGRKWEMRRRKGGEMSTKEK